MPVLLFPLGWDQSKLVFWKPVHLQAFVVVGGEGSSWLSSVVTLLPGATAWTRLASLPRAVSGARASIVGGRLRVNGGEDYDQDYDSRSEVMIEKWWWCTLPINADGYEIIIQQKVDFEMIINDQVCSYFAFQVLEYHPQPWNQWVKIGDLQQARSRHATLSIGVEQLSCLFPGESFNIITLSLSLWWCERRRLIDKQRGFGIDNNDDDNDDNQQWYHHMDSFTGRH